MQWICYWSVCFLESVKHNQNIVCQIFQSVLHSVRSSLAGRGAWRSERKEELFPHKSRQRFPHQSRRCRRLHCSGAQRGSKVRMMPYGIRFEILKIEDAGLLSSGASFQLFLGGGGGKIFYLFFNATELLKNWKKHFICSNLALFIVPFFLSFFFLFFLFFLSFFILFFFLGGSDGPQPPSNDAPDYTYSLAYGSFVSKSERSSFNYS